MIDRQRFQLNLTYGQKIFFLATVPLVLAMGSIAGLVAYQARQLAEDEIAFLEETLLEAKQGELRNYMALARNAIYHIYGPAGPDDQEAKNRATQILAAMTYGKDGFFFVYDYDGVNLVSPKQTDLIGRNLIDLTDGSGTPVVEPLIALARNGGGYHEYVWPKPSSAEESPIVSYVIGLQDWQWAIGTGIFIDDVRAHVAVKRAEMEARIKDTFVWIAAITLIFLIGVFASGMLINLRERRLADSKLAVLTQRIVHTQEEERARVARELHDSISQILVSIRYGLELAKRKIKTGADDLEATLQKPSEGLTLAIKEVRRISRDLRPGALDDLGLSPALKSLAEEFQERTGIVTRVDTVAVRNSLSVEGKTALFRVAQEALTNVERHSGATEVVLRVILHRSGASMTITDNGCGFTPSRRGGTGIGQRNMAERMEHLGGTFRISSSTRGTRIEASLPACHLMSGAPTEQRKFA